MADMLSGVTPVSMISPATVVPHIKSGRLRALAVTSAEPSKMFPALPTVAASGLRGWAEQHKAGHREARY